MLNPSRFMLITLLCSFSWLAASDQPNRDITALHAIIERAGHLEEHRGGLEDPALDFKTVAELLNKQQRLEVLRIYPVHLKNDPLSREHFFYSIRSNQTIKCSHTQLCELKEGSYVPQEVAPRLALLTTDPITAMDSTEASRVPATVMEP